MTSVAPAVDAPNRSSRLRSNCQLAQEISRSSGPIASLPTAQSTKAIPLSWLCTTPRGRPVEPEVNRM